MIQIHSGMLSTLYFATAICADIGIYGNSTFLLPVGAQYNNENCEFYTQRKSLHITQI